MEFTKEQLIAGAKGRIEHSMATQHLCADSISAAIDLRLTEIALAALTQTPAVQADQHKHQEIPAGYRDGSSNLNKLNALANELPARVIGHEYRMICGALRRVPKFSERKISQAIPAGYALVPIEPTESMVIAGFESEPDSFFSDPEEWEAYQSMSGCRRAAHRAKLCWAAMVKAAQPQEQG